ncbi:hypothetical protein EDB19DRAFT_2027980 [Suillus lakei]|nr:hypothetical protein EDB19DRAFT_2027980 [Suillus lakei]
MPSATNSVAPQGAGGKDTSNLNPDNDREMSNDEIGAFANAIGGRNHNVDPNDYEAVIEENLLRAERNLLRAQQRADPEFIEVPEDDESFLDEPPTPPVTPAPSSSISRKIAKAYGYVGSLTPSTRKLVHSISGAEPHIPTTVEPVPPPSVPVVSSSSTIKDAYTFTAATTIITSSLGPTYEIPRPILNLAKAKIHVPLTILTPSALRRIHQEPSCIKMTKGLVLDDPKQIVMDPASSGFPPESSLPAEEFNEASANFIKLMRMIADPITVQRFVDHRAFCTDRDDFSANYRSILAFDIEIRRKFFNTLTFPDRSTYIERWKEIKIDTRLDTNTSRFQPYPNKRPTENSTSGGLSASDGNAKPFRKGKGAQNTDQLLCIICSRLGHRASGCTHTHTSKNNAVISAWQGKLILKSSSAPICISFNIGRCQAPKHSNDVVHMCSICGDVSHGAASKSCI